MARRRNRSNDVTVTMYDSEDREVEVTATYSAPTPDYFDRSWGNWLPGDSEDIEVVSVVAIDEGANVAEVEADVDGIEEKVRDAARDSYAGPDTLEEARGER